jgi:hypothetical protein
MCVSLDIACEASSVADYQNTDMLKVSDVELGTQSASTIRCDLLDWVRCMMATNELVLLWAVFAAETQSPGFDRADSRWCSSLSRRRLRIYKATQRRLSNDSSPNLSFAVALGAAAIFERRLGNSEASETHRKGLLAVLSQDILNARDCHPMWRLTVINKAIKIGVREMLTQRPKFSNKVQHWRENLDRFQEHFTSFRTTNRPENAISVAHSPERATVDVECGPVFRQRLAGLYTILNALCMWNNYPRIISAFTKEILVALGMGISTQTLSDVVASGQPPTFVLAQMTVQLVEEKQQVALQHRINPAEALDFVELTMMLGPRNILLVRNALMSWLGTDKVKSVYLEEGILDEMMLEIIAPGHDNSRGYGM